MPASRPPFGTWTTHVQSTPWPRKLRTARILTYGYDAYMVRKSVVSSNRLIGHTTNLLNDLTTDRTSCDASSRPLIFVTHSLGGLSARRLLCSRGITLKPIFDHPRSMPQLPSEVPFGDSSVDSPLAGQGSAVGGG